jgi:hypothetical protein
MSERPPIADWTTDFDHIDPRCYQPCSINPFIAETCSQNLTPD